MSFDPRWIVRPKIFRNGIGAYVGIFVGRGNNKQLYFDNLNQKHPETLENLVFRKGAGSEALLLLLLMFLVR